MQLMVDAQNGALTGMRSHPLSAADDEDDTDDERGVTRLFGAGGHGSFARCRGHRPPAGETNED